MCIYFWIILAVPTKTTTLCHGLMRWYSNRGYSFFSIVSPTKFSPDFLFSKIAQSYNRSDVFNTDELKDIIARYAEVIVDDSTIVGDWREVLS